ncbi:hypothetical protein GGE65_007723 [Skermanella aerolata]|uniref:hypothetical protein n=1 Tax=Skermanella aerolata TaxID=393310 RepID=UPI003D196A8F
MTDLSRDIARGERALSLIEDPLLLECFRAVETAYTDAWRDSPAGAAADRERCWMAIRLIEQIRGHLVTVLQDGQIAAAEIAQEREE